uniref:Uncharacterized protein n=1 Tax=Guillardia theta TaxID=55529 RepID=A0A7S4KN61_GUITH|mmetsp:Transcript_27706/g.90230  ORF Transcript_27706/g.90230 Transcript_27706/m.90230 type:complete len:119 (+) Transcript_27706:448-804(+)
MGTAAGLPRGKQLGADDNNVRMMVMRERMMMMSKTRARRPAEVYVLTRAGVRTGLESYHSCRDEAVGVTSHFVGAFDDGLQRDLSNARSSLREEMREKDSEVSAMVSSPSRSVIMFVV